MAQLIHKIDVPRTTPIDLYRPFEQPGQEVSELIRRGHAIAEALGPSKVYMLSSTRAGGGVAEMMPRLCSLLNDAGVDARWLVLTPEDPRFFKATKAVHNMLHGQPAALEPSDFDGIYDDVSRAAADELRCIVNRSDVLIVHDPQPAGVARYLPAAHRPRLLWRCHIGVPYRNDQTAMAWRILRPYLEPYQRLFFSAEQYIPDELFDRSGVLLPGIDPLSHKNRGLAPYKLIGILRSAGLVEGPPPAHWAAFGAQPQRFSDGRWVQRPIADFLYSPLVLQVSRFDRLKGFDLVLNGFLRLLRDYPEEVSRLRADTERATDELSRVQLILAGPDPMGVEDDPEAVSVLAGLCERVSKLRPEAARRVHLLTLPMASVKQNALMVNALQRVASVIVQDSVQEGFGLTVTEAMWKAVPVVASGVGGIALQIRPGVDGMLVRDPSDEKELSEALLRTLVQARASEAMALEAHSRVRKHFLMLTQISNWLDAIGRAVGTAA